MEFRLLGPLEVLGNAGQLRIGAPKLRALLCCLLLGANRVQSTDHLIEALWESEPPPTARNLVSVYVHQLRGILCPGVPAGAASQLVISRAPGYLIRVEPHELDLLQFEEALQAARAAMASGEVEAAAGTLRGALALWRGPALCDVDSPMLDLELPRLEEAHLTAIEDCIEAELALGQHARLIGQLEGLADAHPLRERFSYQLMLALYRAGRRGEALRVYQRARDTLAAQVGIEPGADLQRLQLAIVRDEAAAVRRVQPIAGAAGRPPPNQLPVDVPDFTGRTRELGILAELVAAGAPDRSGGPVVVSGMAGVGKSALAIRGGGLLRERFPDGTLYADLGGVGRGPGHSEILAGFLGALGVGPEDMPGSTGERVLLYRTLCTGRRLLVLLDGAVHEAQVRPLLAPAPGCAVVVTSRSRLAGLEAARRLELDVLPLDESIRLLAEVAGRPDVVSDRASAEAIVERCCRLPLAIRIAGVRLAIRRHLPPGWLARTLDDEGGRLDQLAAGDLQVRASLALSYESLDADARRAFRRLGLVTAPDLTAWMVAALLDVGLPAAERVLDRLVDAHVLSVTGGDQPGTARYGQHALLRLYAGERLRAEEEAGVRQAAIARVWRTSLSAMVAVEARFASGAEVPVGVPTVDVHGLAPAVATMIERDPIGWLRAERHGLMSVLEQVYANRSPLAVDRL